MSEIVISVLLVLFSNLPVLEEFWNNSKVICFCQIFLAKFDREHLHTFLSGSRAGLARQKSMKLMSDKVTCQEKFGFTIANYIHSLEVVFE